MKAKISSFLVFRVALTGIMLCMAGFQLPLSRAENQESAVTQAVLQVGHFGVVNATLFSPDGRTIFTGGEDGSIKFWDRASGLLTNSSMAHVGGISSLAITPDGRFVISGGADTKVRLWNAKTGRLVRTFDGHKTQVQCVAVSPDGRTIASGSGSYAEVTGVSDNNIRLWDLNTGRAVVTLSGHQAQIIGLAFSPDGNRLVSGARDKSIRIWSVSAGNDIRIFSTKATNSVAFSPDGKMVASSSYKEVLFWDVNTGKQVRSIQHTTYGSDVSFTPDWQLMVVASSPVGIWDVATGQKIKDISYGLRNFGTFALSDDGLYLAAAGSGVFSIWDVKRNVELRETSYHVPFTTGVVFNKTGDKMAWGHGKDIWVWNVSKGQLQYVLKGHEDDVNEVAFSPDGQLLASCSDDSVLLWSLSYGQQARVISSTGGQRTTDGNQSLVFSPDGKVLAVGGWTDNMGIRLWDTRSWKLIRTLKVTGTALAVSGYQIQNISYAPSFGGPTPMVHSVAFSPDGRLLASGDEFNMVGIWDVRRGVRLRTLKGHTEPVNSVAFSSDGRLLTSGSFDGTVKIWTLAERVPVRTLTGNEDRVTSVKISADNQLVISGGVDQSVRIWSTQNGAQKAILAGHYGPVTSVALSPDGRTAVSSGMDGQILLWSIPDKVLISTIADLRESGWLNFTPDGYYVGSPGAEKYLAWRVGGKMHTEPDFARRMSKPTLLMARMRGTEPMYVPNNTKFSEELSTRKPVTTPAAEETMRRNWEGRKYYALIIGNNKYKSLRSLENAVNDATEIAQILESRYGFVKPKLLTNATRDEILNALQEMESLVDEKSSLLIYYAGHGTYREVDNRKVGFWQPVDADPVKRTNWIASDTILQSIKLMKAAHILIVADSCFSGALIPMGADDQTADEPADLLLNLMEMKSRTLISSGGLHPSYDITGGGHSVFGGQFIEGLKNMSRNVFTVNRFYYAFIDQKVEKLARQFPEIRPIKGFSDDQDGKFIFVRRR